MSATIKMNRKAALDEVRAVGDFWWRDMDGEMYLVAIFPGEVPTLNGMTAVRVKGEAKPGSPTWKWDGNQDQPTLTPSVNIVGHWHGWIQAGEMRTC